MPEIYLIGGANGSGKTTLALNIFSNLGNIEFINADIIAASLSPNNPDAVAIQASRMMLERLKTLARQKDDLVMVKIIFTIIFAIVFSLYKIRFSFFLLSR